MGILCGILVFFPIICTAAYVIHLRDGRSFTTSEYREEGDQIKFKRFGGVIGIPKDHEKRDVYDFMRFSCSHCLTWECIRYRFQRWSVGTW